MKTSNVAQRDDQPRLTRSQRGALAVGVLFAIYLLIPMAATLLYAFAGNWDHSVLPKSLTLAYFRDLFTDGRFYQAMGRSLFLCGLSTAVGVAVMVPSIFAILMWKPEWERFLTLLTVLPYGLPGVVAAVGLLQFYSAGPLAIAGTPWIVMGAYLVAILPFLYQSVSNSFKAMNAQALTEAAYTLGASPWKAFLKVVLPGMASGTVSAAILSFSVLFGEFVLANLLIGGGFETVQMFLYRRLQENGHVASAVVVVYLAVIGLVCWAVLALSRAGSKFERTEK
jgi:putative spermidine/putrescine transport system permease protein